MCKSRFRQFSSPLFNQIISPKYLPGRKQKTISSICFASVCHAQLRVAFSWSASLPALLSQVEFSGNAMIEFCRNICVRDQPFQKGKEWKQKWRKGEGEHQHRSHPSGSPEASTVHQNDQHQAEMVSLSTRGRAWQLLRTETDSDHAESWGATWWPKPSRFRIKPFPEWESSGSTSMSNIPPP